jgi:hypothetical protein
MAAGVVGAADGGGSERVRGPRIREQRGNPRLRTGADRDALAGITANITRPAESCGS